MAKIVIKSLEADKLSDSSLQQGYLYKDIMFDLAPAYSNNSQLNRKEYIKDVQALYDLEAVKNSIVTAFTTSPGDKILNPTYGVDLRQFLFEPIDDFTTDIIQSTIENNLPNAEPRIIVRDVVVDPDEDNQQYNIALTIDVPSLDVYGLSIKSELDAAGYRIV